jgi:F-box/leucine-rich repeat protein 14
VCSSWSDIVDALLPRLRPLRSLSVTMEGKLGWFESATVVNLMGCENGGAGVLPELRSMPSLRSLVLPASCAERAVDAEALCGLTTVTTLSFCVEFDEDGEQVEGEWVLDLSRLPTLTTLNLWGCSGVTDKEVLELSNLPGLTDLNLRYCINVTSEALRALSGLTALAKLDLSFCPKVTTEVLGAVSSLAGLNKLDLIHCPNVTSEGLQTLSTLTALSTLNLSYCPNVTDEVLQTLRSLTALSTLNIYNCPNVTAAAKQALRTAIPNLTIHD